MRRIPRHLTGLVLVTILGLAVSVYSYSCVKEQTEMAEMITRIRLRAEEEDKLAHDHRRSLSLVDYSLWEIKNAQAVGSKLLGDQADIVSRHSWAVTVLLNENIGEDTLLTLYHEALSPAGRLYALFLIHEKTPQLYPSAKELFSNEMHIEVAYMAEDILQRPTVRSLIDWIEDGRFHRRTVLNIRDFLRNYEFWSKAVSVNPYADWMAWRAQTEIHVDRDSERDE